VNEPTESIPAPVLIAELEAELTQSIADRVVLKARITVRDQRIAQLEQELAAARGSADGGQLS
jgi:hypothetical protein